MTVEYTFSGAAGETCHIEDGVLQAFGHPTMDLNIPNGQPRTVQTKVALIVPKGVTVRIRGLYEHRAHGVLVTDRDIVGPAEINPLNVHVVNRSDATVRLTPGDPIASITAVPTEKTLGFAPYGRPKRRRAEPIEEPVEEQQEELPILS